MRLHLTVALLLAALPCAAQSGSPSIARSSGDESTSAAVFRCYEGAGCPPIGSEREAQAQAGVSADARGPWQRSWIFWGTLLAEVGAAVADEKTTSDALHRCPPPNCSETFSVSAGKRRALGVASFALERGLVILLWNRAPEAADGVMFAGTALRLGYHITFAKKNSEIKAVCPANGAGCSP